MVPLRGGRQIDLPVETKDERISIFIGRKDLDHHRIQPKPNLK